MTGLGPGALSAVRRRRDLDRLADNPTVDVLVIGGGVTGAGVALDAAARGLSVVLVERHDLAFGTSRWSSKLVHGGLRYLATGNVGIAHESAREGPANDSFGSSSLSMPRGFTNAFHDGGSSSPLVPISPGLP